MSHGSMMSDSTSSREHKIIDIRSIQVILRKDSGTCEVSTYNGGRDVLLGLGYVGLLGSNISMGFFSAGTLG
jgi:hypothetical protein